MIELREDQRQLKGGIYGAWNNGVKNVLGVLPTGGGKSVITSDIILDGTNSRLTQAVIAHRTELVSQMAMHIARRAIPHRVIAPKAVVSQITAEQFQTFGKSFVNESAACSVVAVDTLNARAEQLQAWANQIDRWVIDEAHHVIAANKWGKAVLMFPNALGLGVTATPSRADGQGLGIHADGVFGHMVCGPTMRELINMGALTDYEIVVPASDFTIDESAIGSTGDFSQSKMREASQKSHIVGDVVQNYYAYAFGKRAICFATDVETATNIALNFQHAGIPAAAVSAKTPTVVRNDAIRRFKNGEYLVLVNVDLFGEGFDVPACEVVIMARPTASLGVFLQQFGRALRTADGKTHGLIIDHVSNYKRHGLPDKPHFWTLDRRDKKAKKEKDPEDIELRACPNCARPFERCLPGCPRCGWQPEPATGGRGAIEQVDGDLMLLDRATLEQMRQAIELVSPAEKAAQTKFAAGSSFGNQAADQQQIRIDAQDRLRSAIEQWAGIGRYNGRSDRELYKRFYLTTGVDVLSALALSRPEMEKLAETVESWYQ